MKCTWPTAHLYACICSLKGWAYARCVGCAVSTFMWQSHACDKPYIYIFFYICVFTGGWACSLCWMRSKQFYVTIICMWWTLYLYVCYILLVFTGGWACSLCWMRSKHFYVTITCMWWTLYLYICYILLVFTGGWAYAPCVGCAVSTFMWQSHACDKPYIYICVACLHRGLGVLAVLDAQCRFPKSTDVTFVESLKVCPSVCEQYIIGSWTRCLLRRCFSSYSSLEQFCHRTAIGELLKAVDIHTHSHTHTHAHTHTRTHARTHTHTHTHSLTHSLTHARTQACTYTFKHVHAHAHAHTHICTHAHTHT